MCEYPALARLAMDILPIQGFSVPCERVFLSAKEITTPRRNRLSVWVMEALQIIKYSLKASLNFTTGTDKVSELAQLEELTQKLLEDTSEPDEIINEQDVDASNDEWQDE